MNLTADLLLSDGKTEYIEKHSITIPDEMGLEAIKKEDFEKEVAKAFNLQSCTLLLLTPDDI